MRMTKKRKILNACYISMVLFYVVNIILQIAGVCYILKIADMIDQSVSVCVFAGYCMIFNNCCIFSIMMLLCISLILLVIGLRNNKSCDCYLLLKCFLAPILAFNLTFIDKRCTNPIYVAVALLPLTVAFFIINGIFRDFYDAIFLSGDLNPYVLAALCKYLHIIFYTSSVWLYLSFVASFRERRIVKL